MFVFFSSLQRAQIGDPRGVFRYKYIYLFFLFFFFPLNIHDVNTLEELMSAKWIGLNST
jgi:hypothetical protein